MFTTTELFRDTDWEFTSERSTPKAPRNQKQTKSGGNPHVNLKKQNRFTEGEAVNSCSGSQCLTGMVVALPLSLLAWTGIFTFLYLLTRYFQ